MGLYQMADSKAMDNNQVTTLGTVDSEFTYSHEFFLGRLLYAGVVRKQTDHRRPVFRLMFRSAGGLEESCYGKDCKVHGQFGSIINSWKEKRLILIGDCQRDFHLWGRRNAEQVNICYLEWFHQQTAVYR